MNMLVSLLVLLYSMYVYGNSTELTPDKNVTCPGDTSPKQCGTACEKICGKPEPLLCTMQCVVGCQCEHFQWREGDKCYNSSAECPPTNNSTTCEGDLTYTSCGTACEYVCGRPKQAACTMQCIIGCQCRPNQWRLANNCYDTEAECPTGETVKPPVATCTGDLSYNQCGTACPKVCGKPAPEFCTYNCVPECQCSLEQWQHGDRCFNTSEECPSTITTSARTCDGDLKYTDCGTACEKTCGKPEPEACTMQCVLGCQCPDGKWRNGTKCYEDAKCSSTSHTISFVLSMIAVFVSCLIF